MINYIFAKQVGIINFIIRTIYIKIKKYLIKEKFLFKTATKKNYFIYKWDPFATEVFITSNFTDWGNEYLFLNSLKERKKNIFFDVGCHSGYFLISFRDLFERSIGFEPSFKCCKILQENKLEFVNCFVGKKNGFELGQDSSDGYSFYQNSKIENPNAKKLSLITLDDFYKKYNLKNVTAIKIDIDGKDLDVLIGAKKLIARDRPSILIENYSNNLFDFFKDFNYTLMALVSTKNKPYNLSLKYFNKYETGVWTKMICCIPTEYAEQYKNEKFSGNIFFGINKKKILKNFQF